jgi:hypothetical protein
LLGGSRKRSDSATRTRAVAWSIRSSIATSVK